MASESRQLPGTNITRIKGLKAAFDKNAAMGVASFLTLATKNRLLNIFPLYKSRYEDIALKKHDMVVLSNQKNEFSDFLRMTCSHFVQVFNLAIERGVFVKEDRTFYQIDVNDATVPDMTTEADLIQVASNLITGETNRIAAGGAAMAMPALADLTAANTDLTTVLMPHSTAVDAYDTAQETLDALNTEADAVIKKVWDEVDTFYNEEAPASQRANAREWGVIYVLTGSLKKVSGKVLDIATNLPIAGAEIFFVNGNKTVTSIDDGSYELNTTLMNAQHLNAEADLFDNYDEEVTLVENEDLTWDIKMTRTV